MRTIGFRSLRRMAGFGLVEIMVAMVIGMIAILVVMQVFFGAEARGRTAGGNADAQSIGAITFTQLQSQIKRAGYGVDAIGLFGCQLSWTLPGGAAISKSITIAPVGINPITVSGGVASSLLPAGDANTDTLLVFYGSGNGQPQGNVVTSIAGQTYTVQMPGSFAKGDRVILANGTIPDNCGATRTLDRVTDVTALAVQVLTGQTGGLNPALFNLGRGPDGPNAAISSSNPSNGPIIFAYAVRNGNLTVCDFTVSDCSLAANAGSSAVWVPIASNVVGMRATYWRDTSTNWNGSTSAIDQTTPDPAQPNFACNWGRIKAISLVLVVQNPERDKEIVTTTTKNGVTAANANRPTWDQDAIAPLVASTGALGPDSAADEEWKHYRYKTFQTLIPLRNVAWMGKPTGCP